MTKIGKIKLDLQVVVANFLNNKINQIGSLIEQHEGKIYKKLANKIYSINDWDKFEIDSEKLRYMGFPDTFDLFIDGKLASGVVSINTRLKRAKVHPAKYFHGLDPEVNFDKTEFIEEYIYPKSLRVVNDGEVLLEWL